MVTYEVFVNNVWVEILRLPSSKVCGCCGDIGKKRWAFTLKDECFNGFCSKCFKKHIIVETSGELPIVPKSIINVMETSTRNRYIRKRALYQPLDSNDYKLNQNMMHYVHLPKEKKAKWSLITQSKAKEIYI